MAFMKLERIYFGGWFIWRNFGKLSEESVGWCSIIILVAGSSRERSVDDLRDWPVQLTEVPNCSLVCSCIISFLIFNSHKRCRLLVPSVQRQTELWSRYLRRMVKDKRTRTGTRIPSSYRDGKRRGNSHVTVICDRVVSLLKWLRILCRKVKGGVGSVSVWKIWVRPLVENRRRGNPMIGRVAPFSL
ncbi:hypothetical protein RND81_12G133700 [Saponaria officinalis]|uniref:Uncharacterized protein n=1 Tax=Saponaria officinalis TaxID=3572 RepID=A0AAW1HA22_SAPOF